MSVLLKDVVYRVDLPAQWIEHPRVVPRSILDFEEYLGRDAMLADLTAFHLVNFAEIAEAILGEPTARALVDVLDAIHRAAGWEGYETPEINWNRYYPELGESSEGGE